MFEGHKDGQAQQQEEFSSTATTVITHSHSGRFSSLSIAPSCRPVIGCSQGRGVVT